MTPPEAESRGGGGRRDRYLPAEDTMLLSRALEDYRGEACLEIGFGSGVVLDGLAKRFTLAVGTDVIPLDQARLSSVPDRMVLADRATCFLDGVFDLVAFNPPYLPSQGVEDPAVDGGEDGVEVPLRFLREAVRVVRPGGRIVALLPCGGAAEEFRRACAGMGLEARRISGERLFFEELSVLEVRREASRST